MGLSDPPSRAEVVGKTIVNDIKGKLSKEDSKADGVKRLVKFLADKNKMANLIGIKKLEGWTK